MFFSITSHLYFALKELKAISGPGNGKRGSILMKGRKGSDFRGSSAKEPKPASALPQG